MWNGTDNLLVIKPYKDEHVDDCLDATLLEVHTYINEMLQYSRGSSNISVPDYLRRFKFASTSDKQSAAICAELEAKFRREFEIVSTAGIALKLPCSLEAWERAIAHTVAEQMGLKHASDGVGAQRQLCISPADAVGQD